MKILNKRWLPYEIYICKVAYRKSWFYTNKHDELTGEHKRLTSGYKDDIYIHSNRVQSRLSLTALSGRLISELCELLGKLSRRCAFLLAKRYSISVRRSSGSAGGAPRGGGASCAGVESDESDDTGVADPHENLHKHKNCYNLS